MANNNFEKYKSNGSIGGNLLEWFDARFPATAMWKGHLSEYYAPKNFNFWYFFGSLALLVLVIQVVTGIFLVMHYKPDASLNANGIPVAFASVEYIMRDVPWGWLIRYMHSTGASAFFIVVYLHMFRGLLYGSYRKPRELTWLFGVGIFLCLMGEAFFGYLLPWGQMSFWGAQVIVNLFSAIPYFGEPLSLWLRGDFVIGDATLNRFFSFHVIAFPLVLIGLVAAHILALHETGSNNPDGIEIKEKKDEKGIPLDGIPFHPYYTVKDIVGVVVFLMAFSAIMFFLPEGGGYFLERPNFYPADPLKTPPHIAPVWYFTPFYSILRAVDWNWLWPDAKLWGVVAMGASVLMFAFLPWLDRSPVKSIRHRGPITEVAFSLFVFFFLILGFLGTKPPEYVFPIVGWEGKIVAKVGMIYYFLFFFTMPFWSKIDKFTPAPSRVTNKGVFKPILVGTLLFTLPILAFASGGAGHLDKWPGSVADKPALQNGAKTFVNYCLNCHGASFLRYNKLTELGFTEEQIKSELMFTAEKIGEPMRVAARPAEQKLWFGAAPPDLTVIARARGSSDGSGADWLYTYLRQFYRDDNRPTGWNNLVFENVGMPHIFWELQGEQILHVSKDAEGTVTGKKLELVKPGKLSAQDYDKTVSDLVSFMVWMGEPMQEQRKTLGWLVLAFLAVLFVFAYALKKAYWKDIH